MVVSDEKLDLDGEASPECDLKKLSDDKDHSVRQMSLTRGSVVFAPTVDTAITTPFGTVEVDSKSVVLIMSHDRGLSVYNLDDNHRSAVRVTSGNSRMTLAPGKHACITPASVKGFEEINPAQLFGYRKMNEHQIGDHLKVYSSEFSVAHAMRTVLPLKQLVSTSNPKAKAIADHMIKTTVILMQMQGGGGYQQLVRPSALAWRQ